MNDKKKLTAKKYLQQLEILDIQINQDIERSSEMRENAIGTNGIDYSRDRVQTSPVGDKLCKDVTNYVAHDSYVDTEIDRFVNAKEQIIKEIRGLHDKDYIQVLFKVYVQFKSLKVTAREMKRSYNYVLDIHKKALQAFEETYPNLTYLC